MIRPKIKKLKIIAWAVFTMVLLATLVAERFIEMHPLFGLDGRMFFHAWYGLVICTIIVLFAKILGFFIKRQENYYKERQE
jgi:hypothetical protein